MKINASHIHPKRYQMRVVDCFYQIDFWASGPFGWTKQRDRMNKAIDTHRNITLDCCETEKLVSRCSFWIVHFPPSTFIRCAPIFSISYICQPVLYYSSLNYHRVPISSPPSPLRLLNPEIPSNRTAHQSYLSILYSPRARTSIIRSSIHPLIFIFKPCGEYMLRCFVRICVEMVESIITHNMRFATVSRIDQNSTAGYLMNTMCHCPQSFLFIYDNLISSRPNTSPQTAEIRNRISRIDQTQRSPILGIKQKSFKSECVADLFERWITVWYWRRRGIAWRSIAWREWGPGEDSWEKK